jgi:hypothetical protein
MACLRAGHAGQRRTTAILSGALCPDGTGHSSVRVSVCPASLLRVPTGPTEDPFGAGARA